MTDQTMLCAAGIHRRVGLRRADWRFLLPTPGNAFQHLVLLGGPEGLAERIAESGIARQVSVTLPADQSADAVAVLHDTPAQLGQVVRCLAPGGVLYYEVDRRSPANLGITPGRVQRKLRGAGISTLGVYWAAPNFENCRRYIPLDIPEAFRWYLSTLFVAGTPVHRLLEAGLGFCSKARLFSSIVPWFAVTGVAGPVSSRTAPSALGNTALPGDLKQPSLHPIVLTSGNDDGSRVVILPFAPNRSQPVSVVKVATQASFNLHTEHEQDALVEIRSLLNRTMQQTVPRPLGSLQYGELAVSIESCARGKPLLVTSGRWPASFKQQVDDLRLAAGWLGEFHRQECVGYMQWGEAAFDQWIEKPLAAYARAFGLTASERRLFNELRQWALRLAGADLPLIWMHNDYSPWNLYRHQNELTVIDWEFSRNWEFDRYGPALYDLLYFVTYWFYIVKRLGDSAAELEGFYKLFLQADNADKHAKMARQVISEYMAKLDIDRRYLPLVLVYVWVDQALLRFARKGTLGTQQADPRLGNRAIPYIEVLSKHVEALFSDGVLS